MIYASQDRGAITLPMLMGLQAPAGEQPARREYEYPAHLSRAERFALKMDYMVEYLRTEEGDTCAGVAEAFGVRSEVAYKDLMKLKAQGRARIVPNSRPTFWEACA